MGKMFPLWGRGEGDVHTHKENPSFFNSTIFMPLYSNSLLKIVKFCLSYRLELTNFPLLN